MSSLSGAGPPGTGSTAPAGPLLVVGAHAFDSEAMAGGLAATWSGAGQRVVLLHVSLGEAGDATKTGAAYGPQKRDEATRAARALGAEAIFLGHTDTEVASVTALPGQIAQAVQELRPATVITHWRGSWHTDHVATHYGVLKALVLSGLGKASTAHGPHIPRALLFAENWEDGDGFDPAEYRDITPGFAAWQAALAEYDIGKDDPPGFPYRDYYTSLARVRGCLCGVRYAEAFLPARQEVIAGLGITQRARG